MPLPRRQQIYTKYASQLVPQSAYKHEMSEFVMPKITAKSKCFSLYVADGKMKLTTLNATLSGRLFQIRRHRTICLLIVGTSANVSDDRETELINIDCRRRRR